VSQTRQTDFHRVLIESGSFSQADAPAGKPVREPMIAAEFDPSNGVGRRLVEVQCDGSRVSQGIKGGSGLNATRGNCSYLAGHCGFAIPRLRTKENERMNDLVRLRLSDVF
jgi:hypothetical protein